MNNRRLWIGIAVLVLLAGIAIGIMLRRAPAPGANDTAAAPDVPLAVARTGAVEERVEAQGRVGPPAGSGARIAFPQPGIVRTIDVHVGDAVAAGQPVARLDRAALGAALDQARADARSAGASYAGGAIPTSAARSAAARLAVAVAHQATLQSGGPAALSTQIAAVSTARQAALRVDTDNATIARDQQLLAGGVIAVKDVEAARAQLAADRADQRAADAKVATATTDFQAALKQADADVATARNDLRTAQSQSGVLGGQSASAQARLRAAQIAFENAVLSAPSDGVVLAILKHPGESVDATQPVVEIGPPLGNSVTLSVPADASRRISIGDAATLQLPQTREGVVRGRVTAVVPAIDPTTQAGTVVVSGAPGDAVPGDAVRATIVVGRAAGVVVPTSAIVQDPQTGKTVVFVRVAHPKPGDSSFESRNVVVRASDASSTSLASGLRPGERVAAQGGYALLAPSG